LLGIPKPGLTYVGLHLADFIKRTVVPTTQLARNWQADKEFLGVSYNDSSNDVHYGSFALFEVEYV